MRPVYWWWYSSGRWIGPNWSYIQRDPAHTIGDITSCYRRQVCVGKVEDAQEQNHLDEHEDWTLPPSQYEGVLRQTTTRCPICCFNQEKSLNGGCVCGKHLQNKQTLLRKKHYPKTSTVTVDPSSVQFELGPYYWISTFANITSYRVPENSSLSYLWAKVKFS